LKEKQDAEISLSTGIFRIERHDFAQHRNGELWFLFLKVFLCLLFERCDPFVKIRGILRHQGKPGQQSNKDATNSWNKISHRHDVYHVLWPMLHPVRRTYYSPEISRQNLRPTGSAIDHRNTQNDLQVPRSPVRGQLAGTVSNRDGIGARIKVSAAATLQYDHVSFAAGYASSAATPTHFGLGPRDRRTR
jgi:ASPIC and UnbV